MLILSETFSPDWRPDWATIPTNMIYVAVDRSGYVFLYEYQPQKTTWYYFKIYGQSSLYGKVSNTHIESTLYTSSQTLFERPTDEEINSFNKKQHE